MTHKTKLYLVETVSIFRMRYVVRAKESSHAEDEVLHELKSDKLKDFSQKHIDENILDTRIISEKEYLELFDKDNDYLKSWEKNKKMNFINDINYKENQ